MVRDGLPDGNRPEELTRILTGQRGVQVTAFVLNHLLVVIMFTWPIRLRSTRIAYVNLSKTHPLRPTLPLSRVASRPS